MTFTFEKNNESYVGKSMSKSVSIVSILVFGACLMVWLLKKIIVRPEEKNTTP